MKHTVAFLLNFMASVLQYTPLGVPDWLTNWLEVNDEWYRDDPFF